MKTLLLLLLALLACTALALQAEPTVRPGDKLRIVCEEEPSLNRDYAVSPDGLILVDFIGAIRVEGLTARQVSERISAKLVEERILRRATVRVELIQGAFQVVRFGGLVQLSGETPFRQGIQLSDIIALARPTEAADLQRVQIRNERGELSLVDSTISDLELRPNDEVTFAARGRPDEVAVLGAVARPGIIPHTQGMTARRAIEAAGGFAAGAIPARVRLERPGQPSQTLDLGKPGFDMVIQPSDRLVVEVAAQREWIQVRGAVRTPGQVEYFPGMTLGQAIERAGGPLQEARLNQVRISDPATGARPNVVDFSRIQQGMMGDIRLQANQVVEVTSTRRQRFPTQTVLTAVLLFLLLGR